MMQNKLSVLTDVCSRFNYKLILSGSFADYFWLNYQDIEDFDFLVDYSFFNEFIQNNEHILTGFTKEYGLKHKKENKCLYRYFYLGYQIDICAKEVTEKYISIMVDNHNILIMPPEVRLNSLIEHTYTTTRMSKEVYEKKMNKVNERIILYKNLLNKN